MIHTAVRRYPHTAGVTVRVGVIQCRRYLHWGPGHPPAERGPSLESIYRVSLTVDLCKGNKTVSFKKLFHHSQLGAPQKEKKIRGPGHVPSMPIG